MSLIVLATLSCSSSVDPRSGSSSVEPRSGVTLLVTNGTCHDDHCDSLVVLGFPSNQPDTPGGMWSLDLGLVTTSQACLVLPPTAVFRVIGVRDDGGADTTAFTWTNATSLALGAQQPSASRFLASPNTGTFVPAVAAGWQITVPDGTQPTQGPACTP